MPVADRSTVICCLCGRRAEKLLVPLSVFRIGYDLLAVFFCLIAFIVYFVAFFGRVTIFDKERDRYVSAGIPDDVFISVSFSIAIIGAIVDIALSLIAIWAVRRVQPRWLFIVAIITVVDIALTAVAFYLSIRLCVENPLTDEKITGLSLVIPLFITAFIFLITYTVVLLKTERWLEDKMKKGKGALVSASQGAVP